MTTALPTDPPTVSVVVLAWDSAAVIERALQALRNQQFDEPFEVVVVWSGEEKTRELARSLMPEAVLVGGRDRILTGAARNQGIDATSGEIIVFLAADCIPDPDWVRRRVEGHRQGFAAVGGAVVCPDGAGVMARAAHWIEFLDCSPDRPRAEVTGNPLYNLSFLRRVFERHGRYDDDLACGEDTLFNQRLAAAGERMLYDPRVRMVHPGPRTLGGFLRHQYWHGLWFGWLCRHRGDEIDGGKAFRSPLRLALYYPLVRVARGVRRLLAWESGSLPRAMLLAPLLMLGVASSSFGAALAFLGAASEETLPRQESEAPLASSARR